MRTAVLGIVGGFVAGVFGLGALRALGEFRDYSEPPKASSYKFDNGVQFGGAVADDDLTRLQVEILTSRF